MNTCCKTRETLGIPLMIILVASSVGAQLVGQPEAMDHVYNFRWSFGFPMVFVKCDGVKRPPSPTDSIPMDSSDTPWTTRLLVPITYRAGDYPARTGFLITSNRAVLKFNTQSLVFDCLYVLLLFAALLYLRYQAVWGRIVCISTSTASAVCAAYVLLHYSYLLLTWGHHVSVAIYWPLFLAMNGLAVTYASMSCVMMILRICVRCSMKRQRSPGKTD
jgi:hypothetical protein